MKQDKFLTGILIGIGVLIVLALVLFFTRQNGQSNYVAGDNPEDVVHNYVLAVLNKDYQKAYSYLADLERKPTYEEFRQSFFNGMVYPTDSGVEVGSAEINGNEAIVTLSVYYSVNDPFASRYASEDRALLIKQDGTWKLSSMPNNFWDYGWYQEPYKP